MNPAAKETTVTLAVLLRELQKDRAALDALSFDLQGLISRWTEVARERPLYTFAAVLVHGWYTGLETLLERIARAVDGRVPSGERSHRELLEQMATELPAVRGAVLNADDEAALAEVLKFRHFFRHAYAVPLDPAKVLVEAQRVERLATSVGATLTAFEQFLTETLALATRS